MASASDSHPASGPALRERFAGLARQVAAARDAAAFAELFDYFAPRLNAYLQRLGMAAGEAEDLAQEVMTVLWHKADLFDPQKSSLSTWLFRIARNRRIDLARRKGGDALDRHEPMLLPAELPGPADGIDDRLRAEAVHEAIACLPAEQVELLTLAFFRGLSHSEIASETGLPIGTVKSRIRLAFDRLRHAIGADQRVDP